MNISGISVKLLGDDILSIVNEFVKINGLTLNKAEIRDGIIFEGNFKKGISMDFSAKVDIISCENNEITIRIVKVKVFKMGIFRIFRGLILKNLIKLFNERGISSQKDKIILNIDKLLKNIPFIDLNINEIFIKSSEIIVEASKINISIAGNIIKTIDDEESEKLSEDYEDIEELNNLTKVHDSYSNRKELLKNKLPDKAKAYSEYIFLLPDIISLIYRLLRDKRVPTKVKLTMSIAIVHLTMPVKIVPKKIPFIGKIDNTGIVFFTLNKILNEVDISVIIENWQGENEIILVLRSLIEYLVNFTGAENVERLYSLVDELATATL